MTNSERTRCRRIQDRLIARIERLWSDDSNIDNVKLGLTGPTIEDARRIIFPEHFDSFERMAVGRLCLSSDRIAYIAPELW